ncbi:hypothetical protein, partial [Stenotrophomonas maltophilia]|uniref:hypothetical protein n=1 Tax=Stenotrophomonas maltophilia TaxID=40324 RepID=UPI001952CEF3
ELHRASNDRHVEGRFWSVLGLCEIANFASLRRHLGRARADSMVLDVARRITGLVPDVRIAAAGRALIEISFERASPEAVADDIDRIRKGFQRTLDLDG